MLERYRRWTLVSLVGFIPALALAGPATQPFTLGKYIPDDCWMLIHGVHNPERDFIDAHWSRVFEQVKKSGIDVEFRRLIGGNMSVEDRAEFERTWDAGAQLISGVSWGDLVGKEVVFAERLGALTPDLIFLCQSTGEGVASNVEGLKAILDTLASLSDCASVTESTVHGVKVWNLIAPGFPMSLHLFNRGEIVGIVVGQRGMTDVLALMVGEFGAGAIVDTPRFKQAAAELPAPENTLAFFDFQMLMRNLDDMFDLAFAQPAAHGQKWDEDAQRGKALIAKLVDHFDIIDYMMAVGHTEGLQEIIVNTTRLRTDAMDKPLCRMLTAQKPTEKFDRYVPKEATGFWVSSLVDLQQLYRVVLDFIRDEVPEGPATLEKWAQIQRDIEFDVETDLFSWWSGEMVSVNLPPAVKGPFASADFVLFVRVKDAQLAAAKVNSGINRLDAFLRDRNYALMLSDATDVNAAGFRSITHPIIAMQGLKFIVGVADDHLVIGSSAAAINACLATAAGEAPSIAENERFKAEGLVPSGPVCGASFSDLSQLGQEMSSLCFMLGLGGAMIPDQPETRPVKAMISMLGRLSPALAQIDFFSSSATVCTFDGQTWTTTEVMNYKPAPPAPAPAQAARQSGRAGATAPRP